MDLVTPDIFIMTFVKSLMKMSMHHVIFLLVVTELFFSYAILVSRKRLLTINMTSFLLAKLNPVIKIKAVRTLFLCSQPIEWMMKVSGIVKPQGVAVLSQNTGKFSLQSTFKSE